MLDLTTVIAIPERKRCIREKGTSKYADDLMRISKMPTGTLLKISCNGKRGDTLKSSLATACESLGVKNLRLVLRAGEVFAQVLF